MDLSQYPHSTINNRDGSLNDPYEDPSYNFNFKSSEYNRQESADSSGRVTGLYSYLDDIGERHTVRYAAGADTGFEVLNSIPDSPTNVMYNSPLYKASRNTRGRMSVQRGPDGQYKFILSGPDQRRSESSGTDGIVRGSYSYLDDKGIQRTVQYVAGAGLGYRVIQSTIGAGTHLKTRPELSEYEVKYHNSNHLNGENGYLHTSESGHVRPEGIGARYDEKGRRLFLNFDGERKSALKGDRGNREREHNLHDDRKQNSDEARNGLLSNDDEYLKLIDDNNKRPRISSTKSSGNEHKGKERGNNFELNRNSEESDSDHLLVGKGLSADLEKKERNRRPGDKSNQRDRKLLSIENENFRPNISRFEFNRNQNIGSGGYQERIDPNSRRRYEKTKFSSYGDSVTGFPLVGSDHRKLQTYSEKNWNSIAHDSTIIKNVGKWYIGLPPGSAVRAHVQSVDILPENRQILTPSEALQRDELKGN